MQFRLLLTLFLFSSVGRPEDWTRFRGPNGSGISKDTGFPTEFGKDKNAIWRTPVRPGKSSPVLTHRHIFLTAFEKGKLYTQCFDRQTGKLLWERSQDRPREEDVNPLNHPAAITPVTDGENVYVFFKDFGLISYDPEGNLRWKVPLGPFSNSMGLGASPIIAGDAVIMLADQYENSYIAAFDRRNGEIRWKAGRVEEESWGTPVLYDRLGAAPQILTASRGQFGSHLAASGKRILSQEGISPVIVSSPVLGQDTYFVFGYGSDSAAPFSDMVARYDKNHDGQLSPDEYRGNALLVSIGKYLGNRDLMVTKEKWDERQRSIVGRPSLMAIRLERDPAAPNSIRSRELWRYDKAFVGVIPSPLLYNGVLYVVKNGGILTSFDQETGAVLKTGRVLGALGGYSASPVAADGKLFLASEDGKVAVVRAGREWDVIAVNDLGESCHATPALSEGRVYLRSGEALYCFGSRVSETAR
jgi:outer membrane protein assembly factor BamB